MRLLRLSQASYAKLRESLKIAHSYFGKPSDEHHESTPSFVSIRDSAKLLGPNCGCVSLRRKNWKIRNSSNPCHLLDVLPRNERQHLPMVSLSYLADLRTCWMVENLQAGWQLQSFNVGK